MNIFQLVLFAFIDKILIMKESEKYMLRAIKLAKQSLLTDDVPVGCVIVKDGKIIAESCNMKEKYNDATKHAEMIALSEATKALNNWWLEDCDVYVTLEPCSMCAGAMIQSRIRSLTFGAYDPKTGAAGSKVNLFENDLFNHNIKVEGGVMQDVCGDLLTSFFKKKRLK